MTTPLEVRNIPPYEHVRMSCLERTRDLKHLSIDERAISAFANKIARVDLSVIGTVDNDMFLGSEDLDKKIYYVLIADTINFGSGWFPHLRKIGDKSGAVSIAIALSKYCIEFGIPGPAALTSLTTDKVAEIVGQETNGEARELMDLYRIALFQLGHFLLDGYDGRAIHLIEEADRSAATLISNLIKMPFFDDKTIEGTQTTYFYKRAQITASDIALVASEDLRPFDDLNRLTIFADNVLPNLLRVEGVLKYSNELTRMIADSEILEGGSSEEVELRSATVVACESIVGALNEVHAISISPRELDQLLWTMGREKIYKDSPRHRCRCTFY